MEVQNETVEPPIEDPAAMEVYMRDLLKEKESLWARFMTILTEGSLPVPVLDTRSGVEAERYAGVIGTMNKQNEQAPQVFLVQGSKDQGQVRQIERALDQRIHPFIAETAGEAAENVDRSAWKGAPLVVFGVPPGSPLSKEWLERATDRHITLMFIQQITDTSVIISLTGYRAKSMHDWIQSQNIEGIEKLDWDGQTLQIRARKAHFIDTSADRTADRVIKHSQ